MHDILSSPNPLLEFFLGINICPASVLKMSAFSNIAKIRFKLVQQKLILRFFFLLSS